MSTRPTLGRVWAASGTIKAPDDDKIRIGWLADTPTYEVLNWMHNRIDVALNALAERGFFEWGADVSYAKGALCWDESDSTVYCSSVENPDKTKRPSQNAAQWFKSAVQMSWVEFSQLQDGLNAHIAKKDNPHKVTAAQAGTYTAVQINGWLQQLDDKLSAHTRDYGNSHKVTAEQAGGVPRSGGAYTGQVTMQAPRTPLNPGAGSQGIFGDATGAGFYCGNASHLTLTPAGKVIAATAGSSQTLMSEEQYLEVRKAEEPNYAVPPPVCHLITMNDISLRLGSGESEFKRPTASSFTGRNGKRQDAGIDVPRFYVTGMRIAAPSKEKFTLDAFDNAAGFPVYSEAIRFAWYKQAGDCWVLDDNSGKADGLVIRGTSMVYQLTDRGGQVRTFPVGAVVDQTVYTFVVTASANWITGYLDGKQVFSSQISFAPSADYTKVRFANVGEIGLISYQSWDRVLTAKQVATL